MNLEKKHLNKLKKLAKCGIREVEIYQNCGDYPSKKIFLSA